MDLRPSGGIFARLDGSGNLTFYDTAGNVLAKFQSGLFGHKVNQANAGMIGTITTTSNSYVSSGFGVSLTTIINTQVLCSYQCHIKVSATGTPPFRIGLVNTTGSIPAAGQTATGGLISEILFTPASANQFYEGSAEAVVTVTVGQANNYYLALQSDNVTTLSLMADTGTRTNMIIREI